MSTKSALFIVFLLLFCRTGLVAQSFNVFAVSDLVRVFEDGFELPPAKDTIRIFGIRGEIISAQCVINALDNLTNVTVDPIILKNPESGNEFSENSILWDFVGSVKLTKNSPNPPRSELTRLAPASFPDYLRAEKQLNINKGIYQSVWLTINIPEDSGTGTFVGNLSVISDQGQKSIPVILSIYPLSLPVERNLKIAEWYNTRKFSSFHGIQEEYSDPWFAMLKNYADNMVAHRQNVFRVPANTIKISQSTDGSLQFDYTRFDQIAQVFWNTGKMDYMETGEMTKFGEGDWFSTEILFKDFPVQNVETGKIISMPGDKVLPFFLPDLESHLRQKGWLEKTLFHVKDEPTLVNALAWLEKSRYFQKYAPDLIIMDAIETTYLFGDIDVAIPKLDYLDANYDVYKKGQEEGAELWFYTVGIYQNSTYMNKTIDVPLIDSRLLHWINYKFDLTGYLHWGWNQWNDNPYEDVGMHIGDAWHVYPIKDGVLNSLRWEEMRNGIQDYEYFRMLEDNITALKDSLGQGFEWIDPTQRSREIAGMAVMELDKHTDDPEVLYKAKSTVIKELMDFDTSPRIYFQTSPEANTIVKDNGHLIEIYGWTEPGTKVLLNGSEVPVSTEGLFLVTSGVHLENMIIKIEADNARGSKVITRSYMVEE
ncbi:DUF4091 domain-containing protein [Bacteroidota bacterium]